MVAISFEKLAKPIILGTLAGLLAVPILAQPRDRMDRDCMREIRQLCGTDRTAVRSCLRERHTELSDGCGAELRERVRDRRQARSEGVSAYSRVSRSVIFGEHQRQQVDLYEPEDAVEPAPLILFVHGGGWSAGDRRSSVQAKPSWFNAQGFTFASTGYRLVPEVSVEEQAADIGAAIRALQAQGSAIGYDGDRIVLIGHSAGAHLAALVASDPQYAGEAFDAIRGVILLDSAGYDIPANLAEAGPRTWQTYTNVFGSDAARQSALSPITHVGGKDAPHWLALHVADRARAKAQAESLVIALSEAGANSEVVPISDTDHGRLNREIGTQAGAAQTRAIGAFLETIFAEAQ